MADDTLRMRAEVVDLATGPLKAIQKQLASFASPAALKEMRRDFDAAHRSITPLVETLRAGLAPALAGLGVASLSAAGAIGATVAAIRGFAGNVNDLRGFSRETGVAVEQLRILQALANRAGMGEALGSGLKGFADAMFDFRRQASDGYKFIQNFRPQVAAAIRAAGGDINKEIYAALEAIDAEKDPTKRRMIANALGLGSLADLGQGELKKRLEEVRANLGTMPAGAVDIGKQYKESMDALSESLGRVKEQLGTDLVPELTKLSVASGEWVKANGADFSKGLSEGIKDVLAVIRSVNWKEAGSDFMTMLRDIASIARELGPAIGAVGRGLSAVYNAGKSARQYVDEFNGTEHAPGGRSVPASPETLARRAEAKLADLQRNLDANKEDAGGSNIYDRANKALVEQMQRLREEIQKLREGGGSSGQPTIQQQSFGGGAGGFAGLIQKASFGGGGFGGASVPSVTRGLSEGPMGSVAREVRQSLGIPAQGSTGRGARTGDHALDAIIQAEGTAKHGDPFNEVLGYGKYGKSSKPLTDMTLREVYDFGRQIRARHGSSSALGAFQIVGQTMKTVGMPGAGLGWDDKFSRENQIAMAQAIRRKQGFGAWEGFKFHPDLLAKAKQGGTYDVSGGAFPTVRNRSDLSAASGSADVPWPVGWGDRKSNGTSLGDEAMLRANRIGAFGSAATVENTGKVSITLDGFPKGMKARTSMDGLFKEVELNRGRSMQAAGEDV